MANCRRKEGAGGHRGKYVLVIHRMIAGEPRVLHCGRVRGRRRPPELREDAARAETHRTAGLALHPAAPLRTQLSTFQERCAQVLPIF